MIRDPRRPLIVPNTMRKLDNEARGIYSTVNARNPIAIDEVIVPPPAKKPSTVPLQKPADSLDTVASVASTQQDSRNKFKSVIPFASNVANSFITPQRPILPNLQSSIALNRISLAGSKAGVSQRLRESDLATKNLDGNTGAYARAVSLSAGLSAVADINEREANINSDIANREAGLNAEIEARNLAKMDGYNDSVVGRDSAIKSARSQNLSNAADKFIMSENQKTDHANEMAKVGILASQNRGVFNRLWDNLKKDGVISDEVYKSVAGTHRFGGRLKRAF